MSRHNCDRHRGKQGGLVQAVLAGRTLLCLPTWPSWAS
jgi:hypothetical protein